MGPLAKIAPISSADSSSLSRPSGATFASVDDGDTGVVGVAVPRAVAVPPVGVAVWVPESRTTLTTPTVAIPIPAVAANAAVARLTLRLGVFGDIRSGGGTVSAGTAAA